MNEKKPSWWDRLTRRDREHGMTTPGSVPICHISYHGLGSLKYADGLAKSLVKAGMIVNLNDYDMEAGDSIESVRKQLRLADVLICVTTPAALRSEHVRFALEFFSKTGRPIIGIGGTNIVVYEFEQIPLPLRGAQWIWEGVITLPDRPSDAVLDALLLYLVPLSISRPTGTIRELLPVTDEKRPLNEGKLILVGRGEVGKTSIVRRLVEGEFRGDESKTQGINITNWSLQGSSDTFRLNIWDFGGQEIMHATHQFFLTQQSIYLLVLNGREGGEDFDAEYWLKHVESFGGESPVIVVLNKISQHPFDLNYRGLQGRYPQIRGFVRTDCRDGIGIEELGGKIREVVEGMQEVRMQFPADWFRVKERLEAMPDEYMGYESFRRLCADEGVGDESDQDTLRWVMHCLGIALNYRDDSRLRETSVLKPEWVTHGIYQILNSKKLAARQGELQTTDLQAILPKERYPVEKHLFLLELMRKFSLCFAFPETDRYLVPELLGKEEPEETAEFPPREWLNFEYHYGVLPEGLMPRFIVRSHTLSRDEARWRSGVILAHEDCKALVTSVTADRRVIVRVKGGDAGARRRLLALIRYDLDKINAEFKDRLDAQPKVPLAEHPEFSVDYKKLAAFEKQGVESFPEFIGREVVTVHVNELLNGVDLDKQREDSLEVLTRARAVFFSYSHKDEWLRDELETHLKLLQRQRVISVWHDRKILPGGEWDKEIDARMEGADIILLLVSADFIASDYCWDKEVRRAMERHEAGDATVIPILLRSCDWKGAPFGRLQGLPKDMAPVNASKDRDAAWTEVAAGIRAAAERSN